MDQKNLLMKIVETRELSYSYGRQAAVRDLELEVPAGAIYGFLGPNGAGKSTTIKIILGLLRPAAGEASLFGRPLAFHRRELLDRVGALIEAPSLYGHLTARENLRWLRHIFRFDERRIDETLHLVGLAEAADKKVSHFSMGMKQRMGIAMALVHDPDLLILDEPVNGLDPNGIQAMRRLFLQLRDAGKTLLISSHILAEVEKVATHVGIIQNGALRFQGPVEELRLATRPRMWLQTSNDVRAAEVIRQWDPAVIVTENSGLETSIGEGPGFHRLLKTLIDAGVEIYRIEHRQNSLEDLFFELTDEEEPQPLNHQPSTTNIQS